MKKIPPRGRDFWGFDFLVVFEGVEFLLESREWECARDDTEFAVGRVDQDVAGCARNSENLLALGHLCADFGCEFAVVEAGFELGLVESVDFLGHCFE